MSVRLMQKNAALSHTPQHTPQVMVGFQPELFDCPSMNRECWEKRDYMYQGSFFSHFLIGKWQILSLTGRKKSKQCPEQSCRCSKYAFLHGVEWSRLIVHWTLMLLLHIYESACERTAYLEWLRAPRYRHNIENLRSWYAVQSPRSRGFVIFVANISAAILHD